MTLLPRVEDAEKRDLAWEALETELVTTVVDLEVVGGLVNLGSGGSVSFSGGTAVADVKDRAVP